MFIASGISGEKLAWVRLHHTLDDALEKLVASGWEDNAASLLASSVLVYERYLKEPDRMLATITYSYNPEQPEYPLLHLHRIESRSITIYRCDQVDAGYVAKLVDFRG